MFSKITLKKKKKKKKHKFQKSMESSMADLHQFYSVIATF